MHINFIVVALTSVIPLLLGTIWYNEKVMGKVWMQEKVQNGYTILNPELERKRFLKKVFYNFERSKSLKKITELKSH
jgi:hypothetical protein